MAKVTKDYDTLYQREDPDPPGRMLATHVDPFYINDDVPSETEVKAAVRCPHPHKAGGHTHLRMEHFNTWILEAYLGEGEKPLPQTFKVDVDRGYSPIYVDHLVYYVGIGLDHTGIYPKEKNMHPGDRPYGDAMEGHGGHH